MVSEMRVPAAASAGVSVMGKRQSVLFALASVATRRRPSALAASDVYRSRPKLTRRGWRWSRSMLYSHGPEPSASVARYSSVRGSKKTGWLTRES